MPKRMKITVMALLVLVLLAVSFSAGCILITKLKSTPAASGINVIDQAWNIIHTDYVDKSKLDDTKLTQAALKAMVDAMDDPYTAYMTPEEYSVETGNLEGSFEGIGASVGMREGQIVIIAPIAGSPADKAGIKPGDVILEVNGQSTAGMSVVAIVDLIRGPKGTTVSLSVQHEGETQPVTINIIRDTIKVDTVSLEMKGDIAYIQLSEFADNTNAELRSALQQVAQQGAKGIILDLRNDPGGLLDTCVDVASHFITKGTIVTVVNNDGSRQEYSVNPQGVTTDLPMVVLVNNYSASSSEVLSGALQDYKRATIAGTKTFGKGSVNHLRQLDDGSAIYITIGRWLTPNGRLIEGQGIQPDIELTQQGDDAIQWAIDFLHNNS